MHSFWKIDVTIRFFQLFDEPKKNKSKLDLIYDQDNPARNKADDKAVRVDNSYRCQRCATVHCDPPDLSSKQLHSEASVADSFCISTQSIQKDQSSIDCRFLIFQKSSWCRMHFFNEKSSF